MASTLVTGEFMTRYGAQWLRHALSFTLRGTPARQPGLGELWDEARELLNPDV
jgi:hypothetical protein